MKTFGIKFCFADKDNGNKNPIISCKECFET